MPTSTYFDDGDQALVSAENDFICPEGAGKGTTVNLLWGNEATIAELRFPNTSTEPGLGEPLGGEFGIG